MTMSRMAMKTAWMMEEMRRNAIDDTFKRFQKLARDYYTNGYDVTGGELEKTIKELEKLGANMDAVLDEDLKIRDEVCGM
jgi:hypothetical protein